MPVNYLVLDDGRLILKKWTGQISHSEFLMSEKEQLKDLRIKPGAQAISDCRSAVFYETSHENLHELNEVYRNKNSAASISKIALILSGENFPKARSLEHQLRNFSVNAIAFCNFDVACAWLGINTEHIREKMKNIIIR